MNKYLEELRLLSRNLKDAEEHELADKVLCAWAALTGAKSPKANLSYSYVMRKLRKDHKDKVKDFQIIFKNTFDKALDNELENPEDIALMAALKGIDVEID